MKIYYDVALDCYCLEYDDEIICLGADNLEEAKLEADYIINGFGL